MAFVARAAILYVESWGSCMRVVALIAVAALMVACGADTNDDSRGGSGGAAGAGGSGGSAGSAGAGGESGSGGGGGIAGTAGVGGNGGAGGMGGIATMCSDSAECEDGEECTEDSCNLGQGTCEQTALADGTICDFDGDAGVCRAGSCSQNYRWQTASLIEEESGKADVPDVAMKPNGDAVIVWIQEGETENTVWAVQYGRVNGWGAPKQIGPTGFGSANNPKVALDTNGDGVAVWRQREGTGYNIWACTYTEDSGFGTPGPIGDSGGYATGSPMLAMNGRGDAVTTWGQRKSGIPGSSIIWAATRTKAGGWGAAGPVDDGERTFVAPVGIDAGGNAIAAWNDDNDILASRYEPGVGWSQAVLIENNSGVAYIGDVAVDTEGNAIAVWQQQDGQVQSIYSNRYTVGQGWAGDQRIDPTAGLSSAEARVGMDSEGNAIAVWQSTAPSTGQYRARASRYSVGASWAAAQDISDLGDLSWGINGPEIAVDQHGSAIVVWSTRYDGRYAAHSNRFTERYGWRVADDIDDSSAATADHVSQRPAVAVDAEGRGIATWARGDDNGRDLFANLFE